ncbi:hypothetical protein J2125_002283 [Erwinia toletana]|uniref:DUF4902 domain-containing protein n=1 Tax=Winslowiella toletana TaxID=92490 RepID=A0ABS4PAF6_9GAMM|nr:hypothetical protein [Winslowiella toletana]MBP2169091.1 hypothetical protein [Winslowiella toletana]
MNKVEAIKKAFGKVTGTRLTSYFTAEVFYEEWESWNDLPIRLMFDNGEIVAISWSRFNDLWLSNDISLPFDICDNQVRWTENRFTSINPLLGGVILSVSLGQGVLTWEDKNFHLDTRLLIETDRGVLDVFNALDENGYAFLPTLPGKINRCIP